MKRINLCELHSRCVENKWQVVAVWIQNVNEYFPTLVSHPGHTLAELMEEMRISTKTMAEITHIPSQKLERFLNGQCLLSIKELQALGLNTPLSFNFWRKRQNSYEDFINRNSE